jgi:asparagine synthase (glutamine-hydrolysing)
MCGLFGVFSRKGIQINEKSTDRIVSSLLRRGPDNSGQYISSNVCLLHQRLSIIDIHDRANQPMIKKIAKASVVLVYNGEIYNFIELKSRLKKLGHTFTTNSDTEVLLSAYIEWGKDCVKHLNGQFSFAIYDEVKKQIILVRDRIGIKPLYYTNYGDEIIFSSDIRSILIYSEDNERKHDINNDIVKTILKFRYNPLNETLYKDIHKLEPGSILTYGDSVSIEKYWCLSDIEQNPDLLYSQACDEFYSLLENSVKFRLRSNADVGIFLSGGIDSSTIAQIASQHRENLKTFTVNVGGGLSEGTEAKYFSEKLNMENIQIQLESGNYLLTEKVISFFDEPILDSILVPTYLMSEEASNHVKVVLSGEGADELFGGYVHHRAIIFSHLLYEMFPFISSKAILRLVAKIPEKFWQKFFNYPANIGKSGVKKLLNFLSYQSSPVKAYIKLVELFSDEELGINKNDIQISTQLFKRWNTMSRSQFTHSFLKFDLRTWGTNYTLARLDTVTMANSLEARVPYFDHRIIEHVLSCPSHFLMSPTREKKMLRDSLSRQEAFQDLKGLIKKKKRPYFVNTAKSYSQEYPEEIKKTKEESENIFNTTEMCNAVDILEIKKNDALYVFNQWSKNINSNICEKCHDNS